MLQLMPEGVILNLTLAALEADEWVNGDSADPSPANRQKAIDDSNFHVLILLIIYLV